MGAKQHNVIINKDYKWTISQGQQLEQVPYIKFVEYRQDCSSLMQTSYRLISLGSNVLNTLKTVSTNLAGQTIGGIDVNPYKTVTESTNPYKGLYHGIPTGNEYIFPYFEDYHHQINNTWSERDGKDVNTDVVSQITKDLGELAVNATKKYAAPAGALDLPQAWQETTNAAFSFQFSLINTAFSTEFESQQGIKKHIELIQELILASLPIKDSLLTMLPPCLYTMEIPGIRYSPACVLSNVQITNKGNINRIPLQLNVGNLLNHNIPDEWVIQITVQELLRESNLIYLDTFNRDKTVQAIDIKNFSDITSEVGQIIKSHSSAAKSYLTDFISGNISTNQYGPIINSTNNFNLRA